MGIGLNYGPAVLGDVGSEHSMSFTVIGDTVNTAARIQNLTRSLGNPLVVGDALIRPRRPCLRTSPPSSWAIGGSRRAQSARPYRPGARVDPQGDG